MKYVVVTASTVGDLEKLVNEQIAKGYEPLGGITMDGGYRLVCQAMIRR